jgi:hypothetical protein
MHMMLGQSPDENYSWHADEAVKLYENMYDADETPSPAQAEGIRGLLEDAKKVQANARADDERFEASRPTEQEEREWKEEAVRTPDERLQNGGPEIEDDKDFHDDKLSDEEEDAVETPPAFAEDVEDVEMAHEQSVAQPVAEDEFQGTKKRNTMSAAGKYM